MTPKGFIDFKSYNQEQIRKHQQSPAATHTIAPLQPKKNHIKRELPEEEEKNTETPFRPVNYNKLDTEGAAEEASKEEIKKDIKSSKKLDAIYEKASEVLYKISSIFPFTFFPDEIIIDREKINIVTREFFSTGRTRSIPYANVLDVIVDVDLFFAKLTIIDNSFTENIVTLKYLPKKETLCLRKIIQGFMIAVKEKIDLTGLSGKEIREKIEKIGETHIKI